ncbi:radical SAM protein [candidate division KSB3 bacterium]|uniref:Radical SAM protein n=1 Tax=candidate division KSB3 bacterium TaxID=2044937 RepID=A0A9D5JS84_9BACT|nr:radical SAM protein [candidate division KSB3 bacterium]MBD3323312.1 radical SAM protein [candidate division KSB3 bacterium]
MFQQSKSLCIASLHSGGVITNYFCSSACRHCLYRCSPKWPKEYMSPETTRKNLETVHRLGCHAVHIGGGEPLLRPEALGSVLEMARETGVAVEYVETNSSWFRSEAEACAILEKLRASGLRTLLVSISPFHNEHIPFWKVKGVLEACQRTGIVVFPWVSGFIPDLETLDDRQTHALEEYQQRFGAEYLQALPQRYWIAPGGRALETFGALAVKKPLEHFLSANVGGCAELAEVSHFHLDLHGNYVPGLCAGLAIQREDLGKPLPPEKYPLITRLYAEGLRALAAYAVEEYGFRASGSGYASKCDVCYAIRRCLVVERGITSKELQPRGHYLYG